MAPNGGDLKNSKQLGSCISTRIGSRRGSGFAKTQNILPSGLLGKTLGTMEGVSLAIHCLPVGTAKEEKRSHGLACCWHRALYAAHGWARRRAARPPTEASFGRWAQELPRCILQQSL